MPKYNVKRSGRKTRIMPKRRKRPWEVDRDLANKQSKEHRIKNIEEQIKYIDGLKELNELRKSGEPFVEDISDITHEEIKQETNFLKKLILESSIKNAGGKEIYKRPPKNKKMQITRQIQRLKQNYNVLEDAIKEQQKELIKYKRNNDKQKINAVEGVIKEMKKEQANIKEKLIACRKFLIKKTK